MPTMLNCIDQASTCKRTCLRNRWIVCALFTIIVFISRVHPAQPDRTARKVKTNNRSAQSDRLLMIGGEVWLLTKALPQGKLTIHEVQGLPLSTNYGELSVPVVSLQGNVILCQAMSEGDSKKGESAQYRLYKFDTGTGRLLPKGVYNEASAAEPRLASGWSLQSWLPAERKMLFAFHAAEGFAGYGFLRLLDAHHARTGFGNEDLEMERLRKTLGDYDAVSYSPDGKLLVMGSYKKVAILNRVTKHIKILKAPVTSFCALSVTADNRTIAWLGETRPWQQPPGENGEEQVIDYFPRIDHVGIISLPSGTVKAWPIGEIKGISSGQEPNQMWARIAYSPQSKNLYFTWWDAEAGRVVVCFDTLRKIASVIDSNAGTFSLISDSAKITSAANKNKPAKQTSHKY